MKNNRWKIFGDKIRSQIRNLFLYMIEKTIIINDDICFLGLKKDMFISNENIHISIILRDILNEYNDVVLFHLPIILSP